MGVRRDDMTRGIHRMLAVGMAACTALAVAISPGTAQHTDAAFTDSEHVTSAGLSAARLLAPQITAITTCERPVLGLNTVLAVQWRWPDARPYDAMNPGNAFWSFEGSAPTNGQTTGPDAGGVYTTSFRGNLLGDLLGGLLGSSYSVAATTQWQTPGGQIWISPAPTAIEVDVPLLIGSPDCSYVNGV